jgi:TIR domain
MSDIFISYKREEQATARKLADALQKEGWSVWWDPKLRAGERFNDVIEKALKESKCVVVMWSKRSVESQYVRDEATYALNRNKLVPVMIEEVELPFRFEDLHTPSLRGWSGSKDAPDFRKLVHDIAEIVGPPAQVILREGYHDRQVEEVRIQLNQLHTKAHDPATFSRSKMFAILRGLFVGRNTFIEPADDCREETWAERLIATIETRRLIQAYRLVIIEHAKPEDEELVRSYDQLNFHSYVQELTGLFDPRPGVYEITEQLRRGNVDVVKLELKGAEIHPKERIDPKVIEACNKRQSEIKGIWEQWPVM